jgi:hypothetical protein
MDFGPESIAPDEPIPDDDGNEMWEDETPPPADEEEEIFQHFLGDDRTLGRHAYTSKLGPTYKQRLAREQADWNSIMADLTLSYMEWMSKGAPTDQEDDIIAEELEWFICNVSGIAGE